MIIQERRTTHPTLQNNNNKMRWQRRMISGVFLEASSIDVMSRNDNTYMCHKTAHFLFHCNTWALFGEQTFVWTCCRNTELMINWKRRWWPETVRAIDWFHLIHNTAILLHLKDICGPREFTNIQATSRPEYQQYIYVSFARSMVKHVKEILSTKKNSIGQNKCRSSAIPEIVRNLSYLLLRKIWNSKTCSRTCEENWNRIWNQLCHASRKHAQEIQP